jgi:hypothetical protein
VAPISWLVATDLYGGTRKPLGQPSPTVASPSSPPVGLVGVPQQGAGRSAPARGELVLSLMFGHSGGDPGRFSVHVYRDGRLIWERLGGGEDEHAIAYSTGLLQQRLTPKGIELLMDEALSTGLLDGNSRHLEAAPGLYFGQIQIRNDGHLVRVTWGDCCDPRSSSIPTTIPTPEQITALQQLDSRFADLESWLPASAWEDPRNVAFLPSRYSVCYEGEHGIELSRVLAVFPHHVQVVLGASERAHDALIGSAFDPSIDIWCSVVTTAQARSLDRSLDASSSNRHEDTFGVRYEFGQHVPGTTEIILTLEPLLPDQP